MYTLLKRTFISIIISLFPLVTLAASFEVIPEAKDPSSLWTNVDCVAWNSGSAECSQWTVRDRYNSQAWKYDKNADLGASFGTWIFSRDSVIEYVVYIVKFISELGLVVGAGMIIYAWYKYASAVFNGKSPSMDMVKNAITGVLVIIFSYAIIKALSAAFL